MWDVRSVGRVIAPILIVSVMLTACAGLPSDPEGTTDRVVRTQEIIIGTIDGAPRSPRAEAVLDEVAKQLDARIVRVGGHGEKLLEGLETGQVDLVFGHFAQQSPWSQNVHLGSPLGRRDKVPKSERVPRFAFRHGENGWIALVERAGR